jgi:anthranilate phosphoribosyltransferase
MSALKNILTNPDALTPQLAYEITIDIMNGKMGPSQIGAFLTILKLLGLETKPLFITAVARAMRESAVKIQFSSEMTIVDIVGVCFARKCDDGTRRLYIC